MSEPVFNITPECELLILAEKDDTKRYLIKQACLNTQQNKFQIESIVTLHAKVEESKIKAVEHEVDDIKRFEVIETTLLPFVQFKGWLKTAKGILISICTLIAFPVAVAYIIHLTHW